MEQTASSTVSHVGADLGNASSAPLEYQSAFAGAVRVERGRPRPRARPHLDRRGAGGTGPAILEPPRSGIGVDEAAGDQFREAFPGVVDVARASRGFLVRAVRYLAGEAGVRQFLDIGTGLPSA